MNPTTLGAVVAVLIAVGGWIVATRGQKTDSATALVTAALAIAERHDTDEHECRQRLDEMAQRVDLLAVKLDECTAKHDRAERALIAAGIIREP